MNKERIKKLIEQATTIEEHGWGASYEHFDKEKFAELIVKECAEKCLTMKYVDPQPHHYAVMLKEHFGVEE